MQNATSATSPKLPAFKAEIVEEGVFKQIGKPVIVSSPNTASGKIAEHSGIELVEPTKRLRAVQGVIFGFRYRISGVANGENSGFEMRALHPPMKSHSGQMETVSTAETFVIGEGRVATNDIVYSLTEPSEVLPGKWTLQLLYRGQVVLSRDFLLD